MNVDPSAWILTSTSRRFWPLNPHPEDVALEDIAHALANQCRFTGHTRRFYSVAQHSVLVSRLSPVHGDPLWGLLHDAAEAYLADVARPLKRTPAFSSYRDAEARIMAAICDRFALARREPDWVAKADVVLLATEWRDVMPRQPHAWSSSDPMSGAVEPLGASITPWDPETAERAFLERFREVAGGADRIACAFCGNGLLSRRFGGLCGEDLGPAGCPHACPNLWGDRR